MRALTRYNGHLRVLFTTIDSVTIEVSSNGWYDFTAIDSLGCLQTVEVNIIEDQFITLDSIIPKMKFEQDPDENDTITACEDEILRVFLYDSISNPAGLDDVGIQFGSYNWTGYPQPVANSNYFMYFTPDTTGWQYYTVDILLSWDNECGSDSVFLCADR